MKIINWLHVVSGGLWNVEVRLGNLCNLMLLKCTTWLYKQGGNNFTIIRSLLFSSLLQRKSSRLISMVRCLKILEMLPIVRSSL